MKASSLQRPALTATAPVLSTPSRWATVTPVPAIEHRSAAAEKRMFFVMMGLLVVFALAFARYVVHPATQSLATSPSQEWLADGP